MTPSPADLIGIKAVRRLEGVGYVIVVAQEILASMPQQHVCGRCNWQIRPGRLPATYGMCEDCQEHVRTRWRLKRKGENGPRF